MSYIANIQGKKESNPINEINTNYTYTTGHTPQSGASDGEYEFETPSGQNMYNNEPISQYDTEYNNRYRSRLELLRTKTESMNMALESALVPSIIKGQSLQQKDRYIFNDTICPIAPAEYVFRVNMVKFKSDRHKRLCYNRTVHIYSQEGDTISSIITDPISKFINNMQYDTFIKLNPILSGTDLHATLESGIDIDTGIPSTVYNLVELGYIFPFLGFLNSKAIPWTKLTICVDHIDTFAIFNTDDWDPTVLPQDPDDIYKSTFTYLDLPFQVDYVPRFTDCEDKYLNKVPIFWFGYTDGFIRGDDEYKSNVESYEGWNRNNGFERIFTNDNHIIYEEFEMDSNAFQDVSTTKFGTLYNKRFTDFDYRFKIKRFNMLCFEVPEGRPSTHGEIRDDFQVESHQFNILKINIDRILTNKRRFKIFYNTRVMYDQDNMLRIKNKQYLADQFAQYMRDVSSNIQVFIDETYALMKKDIGCYVDRDGNEFWYDFKTHFECISSDGSKIILPIDRDDLKDLNIIRPNKSFLDGDNPYLVQKYPDQEYDQLKIRTEIVHFNNMEEGSTPTDEFIYYHNQLCGVLLKELANQIFVDDQQIIIDTVSDLIDRAYIENYNAIDQETGVSVKNEWFIRKNLPEMFIYDLDDDYILSDMGLLDEVFDFTYNDTRSYKENLIHGLQYVIGYDADKLEAEILRSIVSRTMTGSDVKEFITDNILTMSRGISTYPNNNYVMIFKNGELYNRYDTITYDTLNFSVNMIPDTDVLNTDTFEFVFYLNVNNEVFPVIYKNITVPSKIKNGIYESGSTVSLDAIPCNTTLYNPENLMVLIDKIPDGTYNDNINFNTGLTAYNLNFKIMSYRELLKGFTPGDHTKVVSILKDDNMINGLYRVTKQGGGEYFILPSVEPITEPEDPGNVPSALKGIDAYAFANCGSINTMSFTGTVDEWNAISKADDWDNGMQLTTINNGGGIHCSDGDALL